MKITFSLFLNGFKETALFSLLKFFFRRYYIFFKHARNILPSLMLSCFIHKKRPQRTYQILIFCLPLPFSLFIFQFLVCVFSNFYSFLLLYLIVYVFFSQPTLASLSLTPLLFLCPHFLFHPIFVTLFSHSALFHLLSFCRIILLLFKY